MLIGPDLLSQPYPRIESRLWQLRESLLIGLFVGLFLLAFEPFGLANWQVDYKTEKILGFGLITFAVSMARYAGFPDLFPRFFSAERWTVGRELVTLNLTVGLIAIGNYVYLRYLLQPGPGAPDMVGMIGQTFLLGLFPVSGLVVANYIFQLRKFTRLANQLPLHPPVTVITAAQLTLRADNDRDSLTISADTLLYLEANDNYTAVVYRQGEQIATHLLRNSLTRLANQLPDCQEFVRCHRSFLVSLDRVERVTGNAQGYRFQMSADGRQIPIGRHYKAALTRWKAR